MCLFLANHDRSFEVDMDNNQQLMVAWLEEQVSNITEENI